MPFVSASWEATRSLYEPVLPHPIGQQDASSRRAPARNHTLPEIPLAQKLGIQRIELYTGPYAEHFDPEQPHSGLKDYQQTARAADQAGIGVNAGHDLNLVNLPSFVTAIPALKEVSIGHALITDALWLGLPETIKRYLKAVNRADGL